MSLVLGLDIGTTLTIGILIDVSGRALPAVSRPTTLRSPHRGWAEEDPAEWWTNVCDITAELIASCGGDPRDRGSGRYRNAARPRRAR
jgi:xylulokinase